MPLVIFKRSDMFEWFLLSSASGKFETSTISTNFDASDNANYARRPLIERKAKSATFFVGVTPSAHPDDSTVVFGRHTGKKNRENYSLIFAVGHRRD